MAIWLRRNLQQYFQGSIEGCTLSKEQKRYVQMTKIRQK